MEPAQQSAMDSYLKELASLSQERQKLDTRISKIEKVMRGMIDLLETEEEQAVYVEKLDEITPPAGLTEAIERILHSRQNEIIFPTEVRDHVKPYLLTHSNAMASVHTTLKRIAKNNPNVEMVETDGKTGYRWLSFAGRLERRARLHSMETAAIADTGKPAGQHPADLMRGPRPSSKKQRTEV